MAVRKLPGTKLFLAGFNTTRTLAIFSKKKSGRTVELLGKKIKKGQKIPKTARLKVGKKGRKIIFD